MTNVQTFSSGTSQVTEADIKVRVEQTLRAMYEKTQAQAGVERAEPLGVWNLFAIGPIVPNPSGPLPPTLGADSQEIIIQGDIFFVVTVIVLGPEVAPFGLPYDIKYATGNLDTWASDAAYNRQLTNVPPVIIPIGPFGVIIDVQRFPASSTGCFEMNICAQLKRCDGTPAIPYAGFVTWVLSLDPTLPLDPLTGLPLPFIPGEPAATYKTGLRFMVYPKV